MLIPLSKIKGLDRRVRQQMSPEKLEELSDSIKEIGQIVPIKVRQNGDGYVLVYGHRRVMAAKAAGLTEIVAIVEDVPDDKLLTQSLAENVIREDMAAIDIAKALQTIIDETGCTQDALGKRLGHAQSWIQNYLAVLVPDFRTTMEKHPGVISEKAVREASAGTGGDTKLAARVLERAAKDELSTRDTRKVAEVVRKANEFGGAKAVARVLKQPTARIIETAEAMPVRKPKAKGIPPAKAVLFQWIKDPQTMLAEDGIAAARTVVALVARGDRDPSGGKTWLRSLRKLVARLLEDIDRAIERLS